MAAPREFRLWAAVIKSRGRLVAVFGRTRSDACDALRGIGFTQPDPNRLQKVTVLEGWRKGTRATQIKAKSAKRRESE
jgi:hypothetical protein